MQVYLRNIYANIWYVYMGFFIGLNHIHIHSKISINTHFFYNEMYVNAIYVNNVSFIYAG